MNKFSKVAIAIISCASMSAHAGYTADARSNGMGNTGVVSADYLTSPFHNPALGALYRDSDDVGILLPAIGAQISDKDDALTAVDDIHSLWDEIDRNTGATPGQEAELENLLSQLDSAAPMNAKAGLSAAIAIPTRHVSINMFAKGYTEVVAITDIESSGTAEQRYENSEVGAMAFGVADYGVAISRNFNIGGQQVSFGVTPKMQTLMTYSLKSSLNDFDFEEYDENEVKETAFNMDFGMAWNYHGLRTGLVAKNIIAQEIDVEVYNAKYELEPQVTLGVGYVARFFTASVDMDLTKETRFTNLDTDDTQMVRFGVEGDLLGWLQLRGGYEMDLEDNIDGTITAGVGMSPFEVLHLDIAANYTGENEMGASANLALTF